MKYCLDTCRNIAMTQYAPVCRGLTDDHTYILNEKPSHEVKRSVCRAEGVHQRLRAGTLVRVEGKADWSRTERYSEPQWLRNNSVSVLEWPSRSSDSNISGETWKCLCPHPTCCKHEWSGRETCQNLPKRLEAAMVAIAASTTEQRSMQMLIFFSWFGKAILKSGSTLFIWGTDYRLMTESLTLFHFSISPTHKCVFIMLGRVWKGPNMHISHCIRSIWRSYSFVLHWPLKFTLYNSDYLC